MYVCMYVCISPWLVGVPLLKKSGGFRPIAVGEVVRCLTSYVCYTAVKPHLPDIFWPKGQIGVDIKGG